MTEEVPFIAMGDDELETKMVWSECPECGSRIEFPVGELIWCSHDESRPRPKCGKCGYVTHIGKAVPC